MKDKKRAQELENMRSNVDMAKHLDKLKTEMVILLCKENVHNLYICFCSNIPAVFIFICTYYEFLFLKSVRIIHFLMSFNILYNVY